MEKRRPYPSDVTDEEWSFVVPYLTLMKEEAPQRQYELRGIRPRTPVVASVLDFAETSVPSGRWSAVVPGDRQQRRCP